MPNKSWFRFYCRMIESPQVIALNDAEFRLLVSLWCLAKQADANGKVMYTKCTLKKRIMFSCSEEELQQMINHLIELDLLCENSESDGYYKIPRWEIHQYEYKSRTPRHRRTKKRKENGKQMVSKGLENGLLDPDTDTDTDTEKDLKDIIVDFVNWFNQEFQTKHKPATYRDKIKTRLNNYTIEQLKQASLAMKRDTHMMGENDRKRVYATLEYITRNDTNVDKWLNQKGAKPDVNRGQNPGNTSGTPGPSAESLRLEKLAREKGLIKDGEIRDIDCPF